jgi:hypothetical protein
MKQSEYTILLTLRRDGRSLEDVAASLRALGDKAQGIGLAPGETRPFTDVDDLHFLSCSILPERGKLPAKLAIELSFDGETRDFLRKLVVRGPRRERMDEILACCEGYPGRDASDEEVAAYLEQGFESNAFYVGTPGRTVRQIREEQGLRADFFCALDATAGSAMSRTKRWEAAKAVLLENRKGLDLKKVPPRPRRVRRNPANPDYQRFVREGGRLARRTIVAAGGIAAGIYSLRASWLFEAVLVASAITAVVSALLFMRASPKGLTRRARLELLWPAVLDGAGSAFLLAALGGWATAAVSLPWQWHPIVTVLLRLAGLALASVLLVLVAGYLYTVMGRRQARWGTLLTAAFLAWRFLASGAERQLVEISLFLIATMGLIAWRAGGFVSALRRRELARKEWDEDEKLDHLALVSAREHRQLQSHLVSETLLEDDGFRTQVLLAVLRVVSFAARYRFNLGYLATIPSIHFARFIYLPERKSLVFFSNYDGRFDDYLGDFSSVAGVSAVWGNTLNFPRPFLLIFDGARRENLFKRFARNSQLESLVWYSAYPEVSVSDIDRATVLREQLARPTDEGRKGFLGDVWRWWRRPLDEAALAAAIEGR